MIMTSLQTLNNDYNRSGSLTLILTSATLEREAHIVSGSLIKDHSASPIGVPAAHHQKLWQFCLKWKYRR